VARPLRVVFPGAFYHLTSRGNNRARVFHASADYEDFLEVLAQVVDRYGWLCHSYCVLGNHYHLLIETPQPNLPSGMRQLNGVFTQRYNRRQGRCGHLFQARYQAVLVEAESHLLASVRYIAWNPVRAGLCSEPAAWKWSSYPAMLGLTPRPGFLTTSWILAHFSRERAIARERLRGFIEGDPPTAPKLCAGAYAAGEDFLRGILGGLEPIEEVRRREWQPVPPSLAEIFATAERPVAVAYRRYGYTLREIAGHLHCHYSTVSRRLRREEAA
jgi:REP element-mobilizing transposase RayT